MGLHTLDWEVDRQTHLRLRVHLALVLACVWQVHAAYPQSPKIPRAIGVHRLEATIRGKSVPFRRQDMQVLTPYPGHLQQTIDIQKATLSFCVFERKNKREILFCFRRKFRRIARRWNEIGFCVQLLYVDSFRSDLVIEIEGFDCEIYLCKRLENLFFYIKQKNNPWFETWSKYLKIIFIWCQYKSIQKLLHIIV